VADYPLGASGPQGRRPVVLAADHGAHRKPASEEQAGHGSPDRPELTGGPGDGDRSVISHGTSLLPRLAERSERRADLFREELRLFPGREVAAFVHSVIVDELVVGPPRPALWCLGD